MAWWSKQLCQILRHRLSEFGLEVGDDGSVTVEALLETALPGWTHRDVEKRGADELQ